eukprot:TRINITY_DN3717_c0_g2_i5.p1 TRINITY_DN3717_c0_g2~~TRINITY_DN3717_c0_g2_i5.p1  ORF type:complete len:209 (+),score=26.34 TRINITY_DN3717_c0_g2_i5:373-999(+)
MKKSPVYGVQKSFRIVPRGKDRALYSIDLATLSIKTLNSEITPSIQLDYNIQARSLTLRTEKSMPILQGARSIEELRANCEFFIGDTRVIIKEVGKKISPYARIQLNYKGKKMEPQAEVRQPFFLGKGDGEDESFFGINDPKLLEKVVSFYAEGDKLGVQAVPGEDLFIPCGFEHKIQGWTHVRLTDNDQDYYLGFALEKPSGEQDQI